MLVKGATGGEVGISTKIFIFILKIEWDKEYWRIMNDFVNEIRVKHISAKFKLGDGSITSDRCLIS